jgi:hypothetical protein
LLYPAELRSLSVQSGIYHWFRNRLSFLIYLYAIKSHRFPMLYILITRMCWQWLCLSIVWDGLFLGVSSCTDAFTQAEANDNTLTCFVSSQSIIVIMFFLRYYSCIHRFYRLQFQNLVYARFNSPTSCQVFKCPCLTLPATMACKDELAPKSAFVWGISVCQHSKILMRLSAIDA